MTFDKTKPEKVNIECPRCHSNFSEYPQAISSFCPSCGFYFKREKDEQSVKTLERHERRVATRAKIERKTVTCHHCGHLNHIPTTAMSWQCPSCSNYLDISNHVIEGVKGGKIITYGDLKVMPGGRFTGPLAEVENATIAGNVLGQMICRHNLTIDGTAVFQQKVAALHLDILAEGKMKVMDTMTFNSGKISGTLIAEKVIFENELVITSTANIQAKTLIFKSMKAEYGAQLKAKCLSSDHYNKHLPTDYSLKPQIH
jgi:Zn finger protein HypA/HybF involved in hydrogenase expression